MPNPTTTAPAPSPVIGRARAALLILEHAERLGLPMPFALDITDHTDRLGLMFRSVADVAEWALWLDVPVTEEIYPDNVHHVAVGDALDQPVRLVRVERTQ